MQINEEELPEDFQPDEYLVMMQNKFGAKYPSLLKLAALLHMNLESIASTFSLTEIEKLAIIGIASRLVGQQHVLGAVDDVEEILGGTGEEEFGPN